MTFDQNKILAYNNDFALLRGYDVPSGVECSYNCNSEHYSKLDPKEVFEYMTVKDPIGWGGYRGPDRNGKYVLVRIKDLQVELIKPGEIWEYSPNPVETDTFCVEVSELGGYTTFKQVRKDGLQGPTLVVRTTEVTLSKDWTKKS